MKDFDKDDQNQTKDKTITWAVLPRWLAGFPAPGSAILHSSEKIVEN